MKDENFVVRAVDGNKVADKEADCTIGPEQPLRGSPVSGSAEWSTHQSQSGCCTELRKAWQAEQGSSNWLVEIL